MFPLLYKMVSKSFAVMLPCRVITELNDSWSWLTVSVITVGCELFTVTFWTNEKKMLIIKHCIFRCNLRVCACVILRCSLSNKSLQIQFHMCLSVHVAERFCEGVERLVNETVLYCLCFSPQLCVRRKATWKSKQSSLVVPRWIFSWLLHCSGQTN